MTPYVSGLDMDRVSISEADLENGSPKEGDMIARNPKNPGDKWLVAKKYFEENFEDATPKYRFYIPIGDWSGDGHGVHVDYTIESNKPLTTVRELYFQACEKLGFSLDGHSDPTPCAEYQDSRFSYETLLAILDIGVELDQEFIDFIRDEEYIESSEEFLQIVLALIRSQDPTLILTCTNTNDEMFQWYGYDKDNRHIGYFGYGLFE